MTPKPHLILLISLFWSHWANSSELLLTGKVNSSAKQIIKAPKVSRWQVQIQWIEEEGKIVNAGEPVVVFDGANEQNQLFNQNENLERLVLELKQLEIEQEQKVLDAKGRHKIATMQVSKARIEASVEDSQVSSYELGQYELELQRALLEQVKSEEALKSAHVEKETELSKKKIEILKTEEEISYLENILSQLRVVATFSGPVTHAMHPWNGEKLAPGINVRPNWKVADVQSTVEFQIETWIHEIDAVSLRPDTQVKIVLDAHPDKLFTGKIVKLSPQSESRTQWSKSAYFPAIIRFDSVPELQLMPGMSVRVHVPMGTNDA